MLNCREVLPKGMQLVDTMEWGVLNEKELTMQTKVQTRVTPAQESYAAKSSLQIKPLYRSLIPC